MYPVKQDLKKSFHNALPRWILVATGLAAFVFNYSRQCGYLLFPEILLKDLTIEWQEQVGIWLQFIFLSDRHANLIGVMLAQIQFRVQNTERKNVYDCILIAGILSTGFYFIPNDIYLDSCLPIHFLFRCLPVMCCHCYGPCLPILWIITIEDRTSRDWLFFSSSSMFAKIRLGIGFGYEWLDFGCVQIRTGCWITADPWNSFCEQIMISLMPAVCCVLAFVGMLFFYPLSDKKWKKFRWKQLEVKERIQKHNK